MIPDEQALADLHEQTCRWSLFCCRFDSEAARDVVQTVYLEILAGRARYDGAAALRTWLFAVVRHTAIRQGDWGRRQQRLADTLSRDQPPAQSADTGRCEADRSDTRRLIALGLARLPARQRALVELFYYHDLSIAECANVLGIGVGTAGKHLHRARQALGRELAPFKGELTYV